MVRSPTTNRIRVVSYNVLSSHLAEPSHFSTLNPDHLQAAARLAMVKDKLDVEMAKKSLICLQELSYDWAGALHTHCANKGYHLITGLYGKRFNGYMGVAIGIPLDTYQLVDVDISRLSDKREAGWPKAPRPGTITKAVNKLYSALIRGPLEALGILSRPEWDAWTIAENRFNVLVSVQLKEKASDKDFWLGTYHMPCAFYAPKVMTIHTDLAVRHVEKLAGDLPYIIAGDWNIKPDSASYELLTTGKMDEGHPERPDPKFGMKWEPTAKPVRSAYAEFLGGKEPDYTNFARVKTQDPFIDTLDYIFLSDEWKVTGILETNHRDEAGGPFPNLDRNEPSDHIMIASDLSL